MVTELATEVTTALKSLLKNQHIALVADIWGTKNLRVSYNSLFKYWQYVLASVLNMCLQKAYMAVTAKLWAPDGQLVVALLDMVVIAHPHTGQEVRRLIDKTLEEWGIHQTDVLRCVTDGGFRPACPIKRGLF